MPVLAETESGIVSNVTTRIEEAFVALLTADPLLAGLPIFPGSDRTSVVPSLYCFVYCDIATPLLPTGPLYKANVAITLVTNIDDHSHALRKSWWAKVLQAISRDEQSFTTLDGAVINGWFIKVQGEVSDDQQTGDVARLSVGATL